MAKHAQMQWPMVPAPRTATFCFIANLLIVFVHLLDSVVILQLEHLSDIV